MTNDASFGLIRERDHLRPLGWSEYLRWVEEPLPLDWEIIYAPDFSAAERRAAHLPRALCGERVRSRLTATLIRLLGRKRWLRSGDYDLLVSEWRGTLYVIEERDVAVGQSPRVGAIAPDHETEPDDLGWVIHDCLPLGQQAALRRDSGRGSA